MKGEYYKTKESVEEYIKLAKDVNGKQLIDKLAAILPPKSLLLEIGSGPGTDWKILNDLYQVIGSDNSDEFLDHLKSQNPEGEFLNLDAATLNTAKKIDGIYSNKVMHHLKEAELIQSIKRQFEILNEGGIICHSFWKGEGDEVFKGLFVNYHTPASLQEKFGKHFEIILIEDYKEFEENDSILLIGKRRNESTN